MGVGLGNSMGPENTHYWVPLSGVPENPTDKISSYSFHPQNLQLLRSRFGSIEEWPHRVHSGADEDGRASRWSL